MEFIVLIPSVYFLFPGSKIATILSGGKIVQQVNYNVNMLCVMHFLNRIIYKRKK